MNKVLFICGHNSGRSQIAEACLAAYRHSTKGNEECPFTILDKFILVSYFLIKWKLLDAFSLTLTIAEKNHEQKTRPCLPC